MEQDGEGWSRMEKDVRVVLCVLGVLSMRRVSRK